MEQILSLIGRTESLFSADLEANASLLDERVSSSTFLVLGGGGTIGQAVVKQLFKRHPKKLHVVDISENNLVELVRDIRSTYGYIAGDFKTFALDIGSYEYDEFIRSDGRYNYLLNLSALKHVRSEKDPFTLMRMLEVNIFNTEKTLNQAIAKGTEKYFCVSTDKAAAPANLMGASKRIMELFLFRKSQHIGISTARFANVAFSDGSLLFGFTQRFLKRQPLAAPADIKRYFITQEEAGELCLMSCILGNNRDIYFPKTGPKLPLVSFAKIASDYLKQLGFEPVACSSEEQARGQMQALYLNKQWPCYFSASDTTGEKPVEEFYTADEQPNFDQYKDLGVLENALGVNQTGLDDFTATLNALKRRGHWQKQEIVDAIKILLPDLQHAEMHKSLDQKM